ncbi:MAG: Smr/MutS family protein [Pseudomonadota bacterium]
MSRKTSGRRPTAYEQALWEKVVEKATPLSRSQTSDEPGASNKVAPKKKPPLSAPDTETRIPDGFGIGRTPNPKPPNTMQAMKPDGILGKPRMDRKKHGRLTRGKLEPEARIDLHGMTLAAAHSALTRFILGAQADGKRLVLVITGKGKDRDEGGPIPTRTGVLRHQVPGWLMSGPVAGAVLDIATAHRKHGGSGAYYVYLRRRR